MGLCCAQSLSSAWNVPLLGIQPLGWPCLLSLYFTARRGSKIVSSTVRSCTPPLGLLVSGGNTILFQINTSNQINMIAETQDDAAGEALDKGAKLLGLGYPGGPIVEQMARLGNPQAYDFPRAISAKNNNDLVFSGLKPVYDIA